MTHILNIGELMNDLIIAILIIAAIGCIWLGGFTVGVKSEQEKKLIKTTEYQCTCTEGAQQ
jgi:hypothetical protein